MLLFIDLGLILRVENRIWDRDRDRDRERERILAYWIG